MNQRMNKPGPEPDLDMEILVNAVMAAQNACNAASAALRSMLRKRAGGTSGGTPERPVRPTFMAKARKMVNTDQTDTPEGESNAGREEGAQGGTAGGDGGGSEREQRGGDGSQDYPGGDHTLSEDTEGSHFQQG